MAIFNSYVKLPEGRSVSCRSAGFKAQNRGRIQQNLAGWMSGGKTDGYDLQLNCGYRTGGDTTTMKLREKWTGFY